MRSTERSAWQGPTWQGSTWRRLAAGAVLVAALGTGLAACGGDDGGSVRDDGGSGSTGSSGSGSGSGSGSASE